MMRAKTVESLDECNPPLYHQDYCCANSDSARYPLGAVTPVFYACNGPHGGEVGGLRYGHDNPHAGDSSLPRYGLTLRQFIRSNGMQ
jgi:hypothetical protein